MVWTPKYIQTHCGIILSQVMLRTKEAKEKMLSLPPSQPLAAPQTQNGANRKWKKGRKTHFSRVTCAFGVMNFPWRLPNRSHCVSYRLTCLCKGQMWGQGWGWDRPPAAMATPFISAWLPRFWFRNCLVTRVMSRGFSCVTSLEEMSSFSERPRLSTSVCRRPAGRKMLKASGTACWQQTFLK